MIFVVTFTGQVLLTILNKEWLASAFILNFLMSFTAVLFLTIGLRKLIKWQA